MATQSTEQEESFLQQLPQSNIQNRTIDFIFKTARKLCDKEETIAEYTHQTGSTRATRLSVAMVEKYMPEEIKKLINDLWTMLEKKLTEIDNDSTLDPQTKKMNKTRIESEISMEILTLCIITLTRSNVSTELREIEVTGSFKNLIEATRTKEPVNIFLKEIEG